MAWISNSKTEPVWQSFWFLNFQGSGFLPNQKILKFNIKNESGGAPVISWQL